MSSETASSTSVAPKVAEKSLSQLQHTFNIVGHHLDLIKNTVEYQFMADVNSYLELYL
jgi:hypothetical protein